MRGNVTSARSMRAGLQPGWTTADKTGAGDYGSTNAVGIAFGPTGQRLLLSIMTRSQANDADAPTLQPLIAEVTTLGGALPDAAAVSRREGQLSSAAGSVNGSARSAATCSDSSAPSWVERPFARAGSAAHAARQPRSASLTT